MLLSLSLAVDFMSAVTRLMCAVGRAGDIGNVIKSDLPLSLAGSQRVEGIGVVVVEVGRTT